MYLLRQKIAQKWGLEDVCPKWRKFYTLDSTLVVLVDLSKAFTGLVELSSPPQELKMCGINKNTFLVSNLFRKQYIKIYDSHNARTQFTLCVKPWGVLCGVICIGNLALFVYVNDLLNSSNLLEYFMVEEILSKIAFSKVCEESIKITLPELHLAPSQTSLEDKVFCESGGFTPVLIRKNNKLPRWFAWASFLSADYAWISSFCVASTSFLLSRYLAWFIRYRLSFKSCSNFFRFSFLIFVVFFRVDYRGVFKNPYVIFFFFFFALGFRFVLSNLRCTLDRTFTLQKIGFICFDESLSKMMNNAFYFILKATFVLKIFKFLCFLGYLGKRPKRKPRKTSQAETQTITINIMRDISKIMQNHAENESGD